MRKIMTFTILTLILISAVLSGCAASAVSQSAEPSESASASASASESAPASEPSASAETSEESQSADSSWTVVSTCKITHPTNMMGFLNDKAGITVGYSGEVHYTSDGAQTWPEGENSSMCLFCLDIVDENLAWAAGNGYNVRITHDAGKTWEAASDISLGACPNNIDFVDDTNGWISTQKRFASTTDGGTTWNEMQLPKGAQSIAAISLRTPQDGYLLTQDGQFFITADGGITWTGQDLGLKDYGIIDVQKKPNLNKSNMAVADISFTDEKNGTVVLTGLSSEGGFVAWCLTTADGGATWNAEKIPDLGFSATKVFLTADGKYLTLASNSNDIAVLKR